MEVYLWCLSLLSVASGLIEIDQHGYHYLDPPQMTDDTEHQNADQKWSNHRRIKRMQPQPSVIPRRPVSQVISDFYQLVHAPLPLNHDAPLPIYPGARPRTSGRRFQLTPATISLLRQLQARRRVKREEDPSSEFMGSMLDSVNLSFLLETPPCESCDEISKPLEKDKEAVEFQESLCEKLSGSSECHLQFVHRAEPDIPTYEYEVLIEAIKVPGLLDTYEETGEMPDLEFVTKAVEDFIKVYQDVKIFLEKYVKEFRDSSPRVHDLKVSNYVISLIASLEEIEDLPEDAITYVDKVPVAVRKRIHADIKPE